MSPLGGTVEELTGARNEGAIVIRGVDQRAAAESEASREDETAPK